MDEGKDSWRDAHRPSPSHQTHQDGNRCTPGSPPHTPPPPTEQMHPKPADAPRSHDPETVLGMDPELRLTAKLTWGGVRRRGRNSERKTRLTGRSSDVPTWSCRVACEASRGWTRRMWPATCPSLGMKGPETVDEARERMSGVS